ncbi:MAG: hypothetical protein UX91_C0004G0071 [Candidatus Amesbacteria bacterium GW2011_GWB1_47_19]|nr:MAG: hypothetical protein UW51_C0005G0071 [Candidatus Amesbacteria bacterium GW2011_GWA1_44_24]KKU31628.1 MAG: hypothetical protein UX46_C0004G0071 [Candidatus Amesbacteria bacterium GW2011_GWC1_46_24]KKU67401.1 MAG: hypothetical protein UX91_C0004G0071 [Candidatus Amesbacteria bacterium GW2011_GWB1_47_19]
MKKILIIEDDEILAKGYKSKLDKMGYEVLIASDGEEGLAMIASSVPDLILLDLVMPKMDGFKTLEEIKKREEWKNIPVIVSTNLSQSEDIKRCMDMGATDYFIKTDVPVETFITKVNSVLQGVG